MHGTIAMALNRRGRKRKSGRRTESGALARVHVDYRTMAAAQPHRSWLPVAHRLDERAGTALGCLNILNVISEQEYEAGRRYSVVVGAYLSMANAPRGMAGAGRGYDCQGAADCPVDTCICLARTKRFNEAYEAISERGGRPAHMAVNRVAIQDQPCSEDRLPALNLGLSALARHFGLTNHRKS